jgi:hypothetical protein
VESKFEQTFARLVAAGMVLLVVFVVLRCLLCVVSKFEQTFARLVAAGMVLLVVFVVLRCLLCVDFYC